MGFITNRATGRFSGLGLIFTEEAGMITITSSGEKFVIHDNYDLYYHSKFGKIKINKRKTNLDDTHQRKLKKLQKLWKQGSQP